MIKKLIESNKVVVLTVLSYCVALAYETGYAKIYNFPFDMITIDIKTLFVSVLITLVVILISYGVLRGVAKFLISFGIYGEVIFRALPISLLMLIPALFMPHKYNYLFYVVLIVFLLQIYQDVAVYSKEDKALSLKQRIKKNIKESEDKVLKNREDDSELSNLGEYLFLFFVIIAIGFLVGRYAALNASDFYVFSFENNEYAIIKKYDENIITSKIKNNKLSSTITYFTSDKLSGLELALSKKLERENSNGDAVKN